MSIGPIVPCLWLDDQAEAAANLYINTFPNARITATSRYPESADNPGGKPRGSVLTVEIEVAGQQFTLLNGGPQFKINPSISFFVHPESVEQTDRIFAGLADGGQVLMPLGAYPWSERYGWVQDRFGVSWQIIFGRGEPGGALIVPCLMFVPPQHGQALPAMQFLTAAFPNGNIGVVEHYGPGEGPAELVKHGRFVLAGQPFVAMDSHISHAFTFNEAVSLQVMCDDQAEVDRMWAALTDGGKEGPCGWLTDRFGLSWQVVPRGISRWMTSDDTVARDRAFQAMMKMSKPDVAALDAAFAGTRE